MKVTDVKKLDLMPKTVADLHVNLLSVLVSDEFNRPMSARNGKSHREIAIDRALELRMPFYSENNSLVDLVKRMITVKCPHCQKEMKLCDAGGSSNRTTITFFCDPCGVKTSLTLADDAIGVSYHP